MAEILPALAFGTDGVRGDADADLTDDAVFTLGRASARVLGADRGYFLGRDTRESGPRLESALAAGIAAEGGAVVPLGIVPTPAVAHLCSAHDSPGAIISASHNPFHDNGIKLFSAGGRKLSEADEARIEAAMAGLPAPEPDHRAASGGTEGRADALRGEYADHVAGAIEGRSLDGLTVVLDCAHGAAFELAPGVVRSLGASVSVIGAEPDGRNINEACGSTDVRALQAAVTSAGADAGLAFDGDADRLIAVDERGEVVDGDQVLALAALDLRGQGRLAADTVVTTVMANLGFRKAMDAEGVRVVETKVGDRYVREAMDEGGFSLGGEQSGHIIFSDLATTGDGLLTGVVLLDVVRRRGAPLSQLASVVTRLPQCLLNVRVADLSGLDDAGAVWDAVAEAESALGSDGRVLVRRSGTEPVVRVMVEAVSDADALAWAERVQAAVVAALGSGGS